MGRGRPISEMMIEEPDGAPRGRETMIVVTVMMVAVVKSTGDRTRTGIPGELKTTTRMGRVSRRMTGWDTMEKVTVKAVPTKDGNRPVGTRNTRREAQAYSTDSTTTPLRRAFAGQNPIGQHEKKQV